ncbi:DUF4240 domain-containing protein [bacterium]|nr:MAG: DUF4240 domain-containing protein [bacterium]
MDREQFWQLIEKSQNKRGDCDAQAAKLTKLLVKLDADEIIDFDRIFAELSAQSYRHDLWAVAYIVNGGCSDDGFEYFRWWLIAQGRAYFDAAMLSPESAADKVEPGEEVECESVKYAIAEAYEEKTGQSLPDLTVQYPAEPLGQSWSEEDLEKLYPALCQKFG